MSNWRGAYDRGYSVRSCYTRVWTRLATGESDTTSEQVGHGISGTTVYCADAAWPAQQQWTALQYRPGYTGPNAWMGSLIYGQRDFSGLYYRRNRFYDPEQGRFTQEDPIGLAGGVNLYGLANGDPVGYSDPYGLSAENACPPLCNELNPGSDPFWH
jgi:RHS repeat-associated protein